MFEWHLITFFDGLIKFSDGHIHHLLIRVEYHTCCSVCILIFFFLIYDIRIWTKHAFLLLLFLISSDLYFMYTLTILSITLEFLINTRGKFKKKHHVKSLGLYFIYNKSILAIINYSIFILLSSFLGSNFS